MQTGLRTKNKMFFKTLQDEFQHIHLPSYRTRNLLTSAQSSLIAIQPTALYVLLCAILLSMSKPVQDG
jgi:hypothetical protein